jgi:hypothetical protein
MASKSHVTLVVRIALIDVVVAPEGDMSLAF